VGAPSNIGYKVNSIGNCIQLLLLFSATYEHFAIYWCVVVWSIFLGFRYPHEIHRKIFYGVILAVSARLLCFYCCLPFFAPKVICFDAAIFMFGQLINNC